MNGRGRQHPRRGRLFGMLALAALCVAGSGAMAWVLSDGRWRNGAATFYIGFDGAAPNGALFRDAFEDAMAEWNAATPFRFLVQDSYVDPCEGYVRSSGGRGFPAGSGNGRNSVDFRSDVCGNELDASTLAITLNLGSPGSLGFNYIVESDIIFNTRYDWSLYEGPRRARVDFRRVALHELGHALGLGHEETAEAIMSPKITDLDTLTADDIAGATRLYGPSGDCPVRSLALNTQHRDSLDEADCSVAQLYGFGNDSSPVDAWRLELQEDSVLRLRMASRMLDSVLLVTDERLNPIEILDDSAGTCDVDEQLQLPAGKYLLLANTYQNQEKCAGNRGGYTLTVSDSPFPILGNTGNTRTGTATSLAHFSGWARLDAGGTARARFAATDRITVEGRFDPDPAHLGLSAQRFVLVVLSNGQQLMMTPGGRFERFPGLGQIRALDRKQLQARDTLTLVSGLRGSSTGLAGLSFQVYLGYALDSAPQDIHFSGQPIAFSIDP